MRRLALLAVVALALPAAGTAAFPGTNGRLLFVQERSSFQRSTPPFSDLCASMPGGRLSKLAEGALGRSAHRPAVTANGDAVAYDLAGMIFVIGPDGTGESALAVGRSPAWTPDGTRVYYSNQGDLHSVRREGTDHRLLTSGGRWDDSPAVSPDGSLLAYVRGVSELAGDELVLKDVATGAERVIVASPGVTAPDWSPDGSRLAFGLGGTISTIRPDGSDLRTLISGQVAEPAYSPDGTLIAFEREGDIWTMSTAGTNLVNVSPSPARETQPAWQTGTARLPAGTAIPCALVGTDGDDVLVGSERADVFYDLGGTDTIYGLGGDDVVYAGDGVNRIEGGDGADLIILERGANTVEAGAGDDLVTAIAGFYQSSSAQLPQVLRGGDGADNLTGGIAADRIEGGAGRDVLNGNKGPDLLFGGPDSDRLSGNRGDDSLQGNQGDDVLFGGRTSGLPLNYDGYDLLVGGEGNDRMAGGWQKDRLFGGPGDDRLAGGRNADYLVGGPGVDVFLGEHGDDLLLARDTRREQVSGGPGFDRARLDRADRRLGIERAVR